LKIRLITFRLTLVNLQDTNNIKFSCHAPPSSIANVLLHPPFGSWIKANIDNATCGSSGPSTVGGLFRDRLGSNFGRFNIFLGVNLAIYAEFYIIGIVFGLHVI